MKAQMQVLSGAVSTQSINGASSFKYSYITVFNGFSIRLRYGDLERARAAGVNDLVAAGNETSSSYLNSYGNNLTLAQYPDNAIVATPSTLPMTLSVASVDNVSYRRNHFLLGRSGLLTMAVWITLPR